MEGHSFVNQIDLIPCIISSRTLGSRNFTLHPARKSHNDKVCAHSSRRAEPERRTEMRTLTSYGIGVVIVLAILNAIVWRAGTPQLHELNVFSAGFILGMVGMYIAACLYGYRRVT
jgi:hypothetical protein